MSDLGDFIMEVKDKKIDVICQHAASGEVIPIKIRMVDDDGEWQIYKIKAYKILSCPGMVHLPNNVGTTMNIWSFECQIVIFDRIRTIRLCYNLYEGVWKLIGEA